MRIKRVTLKFVIMLALFFIGINMTGCVTQGKSAYQIALENGFTGTEQEWLDSLKGSDGFDGVNGIDGKDGQGITIDDLFEAYLVSNPNATYEEFLRDFLVVNNYDTEYAATRAMKSVVRIRSRFPSDNGTFYGEGSGVLYKTAGEVSYIITNYHVVYNLDCSTKTGIADLIIVGAYGMAIGIDALFVGGSIDNDIAIIKVFTEQLPDFVTLVTVADSNDLVMGSKAIAVGNPLAEGFSVTSGIISVDSEFITLLALDSTTESTTYRTIRVDAPINSGNSGGGLFNARGELIGIVNAKLIDEEIENVGFAIPSNVAIGITDCVIENRSNKCRLGVSIKGLEPIVQYNSKLNKLEIIETIEIESIDENSLADGKLEVGDIIVSAYLNDETPLLTTRSFHLSEYLYKARSGDILTLSLIRDSATMELQFNIEEKHMYKFR